MLYRCILSSICGYFQRNGTKHSISLGEPKPSRTHPGRLARFMVAISDRIAVWIENAVYRADAIEPFEQGSIDEHIRLDAEKPLIC